MKSNDYYSILGLDKTANDKEIKKAYHKLAKKHHPDVGGDENEFKKISEAYDVLSNPTSKSNYDNFGDPKGNPFHNINYDDYFSHKEVKVGSNIKIQFNLTLEEVFNGVTKNIKYTRSAPCFDCNSSGGFDFVKCNTCNGLGFRLIKVNTPFGVMTQKIECYDCGGHKTKPTKICQKCNGNGVIKKQEEIKIDIPSGVKNNSIINYPAMGNGIKNGSSGSLLIIITEKEHELFLRDSTDNLRCKLTLPYESMVLGDDVIMNTIDGSDIKVKIPKLRKIGDQLRISGKGMKHYKYETRGDLIIVLDIKMPTEILEEEEKLLNEIKNIKNG